MSNWQIIDEQEIYNNQWIQLHHYNVVNPNGGKGIYGKVSFKNIAIGIAALDADKNIYLVGQHRFPLNKYSWEIAEGGCPLNEKPLQAAQRELLEETGLVANNWTKIIEADLSNSVTNEKCIIYIAQNLQQKTACPEETEDLQIKKISLQQAFTMLNNSEITDAITIMALQKIELMILKNEL